ncbi:MAG: HEPN domain-containing protein [candidate division Zixibacteria bacterium]|nr:HEPN domain-containing protein [candidate division Zixibacteria bacterium]
MTNEKEAREGLAKAAASLRACQYLLNGGFYVDAASKAYYVMFHTAQALLLSVGKSYSSHRATAAAFAEAFVKTGEFPKEFHRRLTKAFGFRMGADYKYGFEIPEDKATELYGWAAEFLAAAEDYLKKG